jgi:hypothetical protein
MAEADILCGENWFDPLEASVRTRIRGFIEGLLESELDMALARKRYEPPTALTNKTTERDNAPAKRWLVLRRWR